MEPQLFLCLSRTEHKYEEKGSCEIGSCLPSSTKVTLLTLFLSEESYVLEDVSWSCRTLTGKQSKLGILSRLYT